MGSENHFKQLCRMVLPKKIVYGLTYTYNSIKATPEIKKKWKENIKFKNIHIGERCFILGNGPSLKDVCLDELKDEFVFTVNNFSTIDKYEAVNTNVHLWFDGGFFALENNDKFNIIENYQKIAKSGAICFAPIVSYDFFKENGLDKILNINYLLPRKKITDDSIERIELDKLIYQCVTVIQYAIQIAIYMGFSEIYLLGCDATNVIGVILNGILDQSLSLHASDQYMREENPKKILETWNMPDMFYSEYLFFLGYQQMAEYCKKNNIRLCNCSSRTLINEIEKKELNDVLHN